MPADGWQSTAGGLHRVPEHPFAALAPVLGSVPRLRPPLCTLGWSPALLSLGYGTISPWRSTQRWGWAVGLSCAGQALLHKTSLSKVSCKSPGRGQGQAPAARGGGALGGLPTFAVSISLCRSLPAPPGREGNMAEGAGVLYFAPYFILRLFLGSLPDLVPSTLYSLWCQDAALSHCRRLAGQHNSKILL